MRTINGIDELRAAEGETLGTSGWHEVTQEAINGFAMVTGDHQWIHVDPGRAKDTPFGGTIAHGYYTLSLAPALTAQVVRFEGFAFALNYGLNRVRFPSPLPVGGRVRVTARIAGLEDVPGGTQMTLELTFEREGGEKPVCVAESLSRLYAPQDQPRTFHIGFFIDGEDRVDEINRRLKEDGFDVAPPQRSHAYGFYVQAPGGFTVELGA